MRIKLWGVRGSYASAVDYHTIENKIRQVLTLATPGDIISPDRIEDFIERLPFSLKGTFGGNTTCVEIMTDDKELLIIDGGTGLTALGNALMKNERWRTGSKIHHFFTHTHWDHIQGVMFFGPFFVPENHVTFYSSFEDIMDRLRYQTPPTHFPITFDDLPIQKDFIHISEKESHAVAGLEVNSMPVRHPGGTYSYKFTQKDGKKFIFCSDAEFNIDVMDDIVTYIEYFKDADVLVFDTQYTFEESLQKIDWGHSSASIATDIAVKSNVKKLILFHHDPSYDDDKMDALTMIALKYKDMMAPNHPLEIVAAYEGLEIIL